MSDIAVREFLDRVGKDEALQTELTQSLTGTGERQIVMEFARLKGYVFSVEELMTEVHKRQAAHESKESEELSDEDLKTVAGGSSVPRLYKGELPNYYKSPW